YREGQLENVATSVGEIVPASAPGELVRCSWRTLVEAHYENVNDDPGDGAFLDYPGEPACWVPILSKENAAALCADSRAVTVTYRRHRFLIPQYRALNLDDFRQSVDKFRRLESQEAGIQCLFRGQTRDYFDKTGSLGCLPAAARRDYEAGTT